MMREEIGLNIKVKKSELLAKIKENREKHHKIFLEALDGYQKKMIKVLLQMLKEVRKGKRIQHMINLPLPQDMTQSYDTVIGMLEMSTEEEIKLSSMDFSKFVEDKWEWSRNFLHSNAPYSTVAMMALGSEGGEDD